ncbi:MAG: Holliday junction branch migration protein RuvA [Clostridia bacterium]|nr:Holliday junction branch migration protein RuvA [Clostridia bacterium]
MIGFLNGIYKGCIGSYIWLECGGVGFEICATNSVLSNLPLENESMKVYTFMNVKEDEMSLFGFASMEEKQLFLKLISVSGVGAKTAIQILSMAKFNDIVSSILTEDSSVIASVKGIGKKTAERIVLELKDKLNPYEYILPMEQIGKPQVEPNALQDAITALTQLGMRQIEASTIARQVAKEGDNAEDIISKVLRNMGA